MSVKGQEFVAVKIIRTSPVAVSAPLGMYVAERFESFGTNAPVPSEDHCPVVLLPDTDPKRNTVSLLAQTTVSLPATTMGFGVKETFIVS
mgnify:CR=1 FL=1